MRGSHPTSLLAAALAVALAALPAMAESPAPAPGSPRAGFRADYLMELDRLRSRTLALAEEIPADRWTAAPDRSGHSLAECFTGLAVASRRILAGMEGEEPAAAEAESAAEKSQIAGDLGAAFDAARRAVEQTPGEGLEAPVDFLGRRWTVRALFLLLLGQMHEGLGHAAAHAESAGIEPPWVKARRISDESGDD